MNIVSIHNFYPFQDIKQNVLLSSYLDSWWHHKHFSVFEGLSFGEKIKIFKKIADKSFKWFE